MGILEPLYSKAESECLSPSTGQAVTVNGVSVTPPQGLHGLRAEPAPCWPLPAAHHLPGPHPALGWRRAPAPSHLTPTLKLPTSSHSFSCVVRVSKLCFHNYIFLHYESNTSSPKKQFKNTKF